MQSEQAAATFSWLAASNSPRAPQVHCGQAGVHRQGSARAGHGPGDAAGQRQCWRPRRASGAERGPGRVEGAGRCRRVLGLWARGVQGEAVCTRAALGQGQCGKRAAYSCFTTRLLQIGQATAAQLCLVAADDADALADVWSSTNATQCVLRLLCADRAFGRSLAPSHSPLATHLCLLADALASQGDTEVPQSPATVSSFCLTPRRTSGRASLAGPGGAAADGTAAHQAAVRAPERGCRTRARQARQQGCGQACREQWRRRCGGCGRGRGCQRCGYHPHACHGGSPAPDAHARGRPRCGASCFSAAARTRRRGVACAPPCAAARAHRSCARRRRCAGCRSCTACLAFAGAFPPHLLWARNSLPCPRPQLHLWRALLLCRCRCRRRRRRSRSSSSSSKSWDLLRPPPLPPPLQPPPRTAWWAPHATGSCPRWSRWARTSGPARPAWKWRSAFPLCAPSSRGLLAPPPSWCVAECGFAACRRRSPSRWWRCWAR